MKLNDIIKVLIIMILSIYVFVLLVAILGYLFSVPLG